MIALVYLLVYFNLILLNLIHSHLSEQTENGPPKKFKLNIIGDDKLASSS